MSWRVLLLVLDERQEVGGVDVVVDVSVGVGCTGVFRGETPLAVDDELVAELVLACTNADFEAIPRSL